MHQDIFALANNIPANKPTQEKRKNLPTCVVMEKKKKEEEESVSIVRLPNSMLKKLGTLRGTLNNINPAIDIGILFKEPTRLRIQ